MRTLRHMGSVRRTVVRPVAAARFHVTTQAHTRQHPRIRVKKKPTEHRIPRSWKPFEVPDILLDLDSWENDYTVPFDEVERALQRKKWAVNPTADSMDRRIEKFEYRFKAATNNHANIIKDISWRPWHVTDLDIMTAAVKGVPTNPTNSSWEKKSYDELRTAITKNGVPSTTLDGGKRLLEWLLHRRTEMRPQPGKKSIPRLIGEQKTSTDLRRLLSGLLRSPDTRKTVVANSDKIGVAFSAIIGERIEPCALSVLPFINALLSYCQKSKSPLGVSLCSLGIRMSAQAFKLEATKWYLMHGDMQGYWKKDPEPILSTLRILRFRLSKIAATRDHPTSRHALHDLQTYRTELSLLLEESPGVASGLFKKVVDGYPEDKTLRSAYNKLLAAVKKLPEEPLSPPKPKAQGCAAAPPASSQSNDQAFA